MSEGQNKYAGLKGQEQKKDKKDSNDRNRKENSQMNTNQTQNERNDPQFSPETKSGITSKNGGLVNGVGSPNFNLQQSEKQNEVVKNASGMNAIAVRDNYQERRGHNDKGLLQKILDKVKDNNMGVVGRDVRDIKEKVSNSITKIDDLTEMILDRPKNVDLEDTAEDIIKKIDKHIYDVKSDIISRNEKSVKDVKRDLADFNAVLNEIINIKLKDIANDTELIQSLPGKIDNIDKTLKDKGIRLKQEFPAVSHDEETLAELTECGEKILQQLSIAARWYARKKPEMEDYERKLKNLSDANERAKEQAKNEGFEEGRKAVITNLLISYDDINALMTAEPENADKRLKVLATFLKNQGVEPIYEINKELEITDDNLGNFEHNINNLKKGIGKIIITSPGYTFGTKTISKASYKIADEVKVTQEKEISSADQKNAKSISETKHTVEEKISESIADGTKVNSKDFIDKNIAENEIASGEELGCKQNTGTFEKTARGVMDNISFDSTNQKKE